MMHRLLPQLPNDRRGSRVDQHGAPPQRTAQYWRRLGGALAAVSIAVFAAAPAATHAEGGASFGLQPVTFDRAAPETESQFVF